MEHRTGKKSVITRLIFMMLELQVKSDLDAKVKL